MSRPMVRRLSCFLLPIALLCGLPRTALSAEKVVIPFDFASKFDDGRYGQIVGELIWKKLEREGQFVIPETMQDVRDACERLKFHPGYDTAPADVERVLHEEFDADIAIWGSVERVPPHETDVYDFSLKVVDFSGDEPAVVYEGKHRTKTVSEIPHLYVKNAMMALHGQTPDAPPPPDPEVEKRWKEGPNLLANGTFEKGQAAPSGWDPLPQYVELVQESPREHHLRMEFPKSVAATTGVLYYSDMFPVTDGATYRFSCRYRTSGSAVKVFIKCYDEFTGTGPQGPRTLTQRREIYRSQQNLKGAAGQWHTHVEDFTPKHSKYTPRWGRVMLYAYWPAGAVEWDDVVVKLVKPAERSRDKVSR